MVICILTIVNCKILTFIVLLSYDTGGTTAEPFGEHKDAQETSFLDAGKACGKNGAFIADHKRHRRMPYLGERQVSDKDF